MQRLCDMKLTTRQTAPHFLLTMLPSPGKLGSVPPMGLADLIEHVTEESRWRKLVEAIILLDDLQQREAFLAGEIEEVEPAVLTLQQARGEAPLPEILVAEGPRDQPGAMATDRLWETYFRYVHALGRSERSRFLVQWVEFEIALRNALATARARSLGLVEGDYVVAADLADGDEDPSAVVDEWAAAPTPLAGLQAVIRGRWSWVQDHDGWFSFSVDELLAYAVRVMLLEQWRRSSSEEEEAAKNRP